jgi:hypothetical protein
MKISSIRYEADIDKCVEMYIAKNYFPFADPVASKKNLHKLVRSGAFNRTLIYDGEIIAWILCRPYTVLHLNEPVFQQTYFCSNRFGYRSVELLHKEMIKASPVDLLFSESSFTDTTNIFTRMLEKLGWNRKGSLAWSRKSDHLI